MSSNPLPDSDSEETNDSKKSHIPKVLILKHEFFGNVLDESSNLYKQKFSKIKDMLSFTVENRGIKESHINDLYQHYKTNTNTFIPPLHIMSYFTEIDGEKFYIADGQHRVEALKKLLLNDKIDRDVIYFIHDVNSEDDIRKCIKNLNSSNPVSSLFPFEKVANFIKKLKDTFPLLFSPNKNHNMVKINEIILRDKMYEMNFFESIKLSETQIFSELLNYNERVKNNYIAKTIKSRPDVDLYTRIYEKHKFYCLLVRNYTWLDTLYNHLLNFRF
jgi:hypothetical protein